MKSKPVPRVAVSGLVKKQFEQLVSRLSRYPFKLVRMDPKVLLCRRRINSDLVAITRFAGHKHFAHAKQISSGSVIRVDHGTSHAVADAIMEFFRRKGNVA